MPFDHCLTLGHRYESHRVEGLAKCGHLPGRKSLRVRLRANGFPDRTRIREEAVLFIHGQKPRTKEGVRSGRPGQLVQRLLPVAVFEAAASPLNRGRRTSYEPFEGKKRISVTSDAASEMTEKQTTVAIEIVAAGESIPVSAAKKQTMKAAVRRSTVASMTRA